MVEIECDGKTFKSWKKYAQHLEKEWKRIYQLIHPPDSPYLFDKTKWKIIENDENHILIGKQKPAEVPCGASMGVK